METTIQKQLQDAQLCILKEIDRVCSILEIDYFLAFGTAIGAVRHQGFIPWDDDIDIYMTFEDLEKLEHHRELFSPCFFVQNSKTDPEYGLMITRIRNSNTTLIENEEINRDINHGIFVDIYPLYNAPTNKSALKAMCRWSLVGRLFLYGEPPRNHGKLMKIISIMVLKITPKAIKKGIVDKSYEKVGQYKETGFLTRARKDGKSVPVFPKDYFFPAQRVVFEDMMAPVPAKNHEILTILYGDYMKLPPEEKRVVHHNYRKVDCKNSYKKYKGVDYCLKKG